MELGEFCHGKINPITFSHPQKRNLESFLLLARSYSTPLYRGRQFLEPFELIAYVICSGCVIFTWQAFTMVL